MVKDDASLRVPTGLAATKATPPTEHCEVVARIKGGLGNQLFCYAAARRLAVVCGVELVLDHISGFERDTKYKRTYNLDEFSIPARKARRNERWNSGPVRRRLLEAAMGVLPYSKRPYIHQRGSGFDSRLLGLRIRRRVYLDGYWQSDRYFKDIESTIRQDLEFRRELTPSIGNLAQEVSSTNAVAIHVRNFGMQDPGSAGCALGTEYYGAAIQRIQETIGRPRYFLFSDDNAFARQCVQTLAKEVRYVSELAPDATDLDQFRLMSLCRHFIIANSTYSWWAGWLGAPGNKIVIAPSIAVGGVGRWGSEGLIPDEWVRLP